jgi:hypothetical protein
MARQRGSGPGGGRQNQSFLATQFAAVSAGGWQQTLTAIRGVADNLQLATRAALGWDKVQRTITINAAALAKAFANIGPGLAQGLLAPLRSLQSMASGVAEGTLEGERLAASFTQLHRVLAADLGPWIRILIGLVQDLTEWWRNLDSGLKKQIAMWVAVTAAVGALVALIPALTAAVGALVAGFIALYAVITSPFVVIPVLIVAAATAVAAFFGLISGDSKKASEAMGGNFGAWIDLIFDGIKYLGVQFVRFFNWLSKHWNAILLKIGEVSIITAFRANFATMHLELIKWRATMAGIAAQDIQGPQLDEAAWNEMLERMRGKFKGFVGGLPEFLGALGGRFGQLLKLFDKIGQGKPLQLKFNVQWEGLQGTFDRLQAAFAGGVAAPEEKQVDLLQEIKGLIGGVIDDVKKLGAAIPAAR